MAWRPTRFLVEGMLDNTQLGRVTGWMRFAGVEGKVTFDLEGDFHRDIRGARIRLKGDAGSDTKEAGEYMKSFARHQTGKVGDMTAGLPPADYVSGYCCLEWYSDENGRVVIELEQSQVELLGKPIPACESEPISRQEQNRNMAEFLASLAKEANVPRKRVVCLRGSGVLKAAERATSKKVRGMKLLTAEVRKKLPPLQSQDGEGGKAVAQVKFFMPDGGWSWWAVEGSAVKDSQGREVDFHFFGLVQGIVKELGYFSLSELESVRGALGLPVERDLYWHPKTLEEIAPEMFGKAKGKEGASESG